MKPAIPRRLRNHPWFFGALAALALVAAAGAMEAWRQGRRARTGTEEVARLRIERLSSQTQPEMVAAAGAALDRAQAELRQARADWPGTTESTTAPADRLGAYAELMAFIERNRAAARASGVEVAKRECFGFGRHAQVAPSEGEVAAVLEQVSAVERVLAVLFAAEPAELVGVWREAPDTAGPGANASGTDEWCVLEPARSVRVPGMVQARALRVEFVGTTGCLRRFLNGLAAAPALVVCEVAAAKPEATDRRGTRQESRAGWRRFSVTLEAVTVAGGTGEMKRGGGTPAPVWAVDEGAAGFALFAPAGIGVAEAGQRRDAAAGPAASPKDGHSLGIELVAVRRVPYRWRVVGHAGGPGGEAAMLEDAVTRRSVLLRAGARDAVSGVVLQTLECLRARDGSRVVHATLFDPGEPGPIVLTTAGGEGPARVVAMLRVAGQTAPLTVPEGATVRSGGADYVVGRFSVEPAAVELARTDVAGAKSAVRLSVSTK